MPTKLELLKIVQELEGKPSPQRKDIIIRYLEDFGIQYERDNYGSGENIIVSQKDKSVGISCHFDKVAISPGANDDASGVAVVLDILLLPPLKHLGIRGMFFDDEEGGRNGSKQYVLRHSTQGLIGLYNLDMVGIGRSIIVWSKEPPSTTPLYLALTKVAQRQWLPMIKVASGPFKSDHEHFAETGLEAFSITALTNLDFLFVKKYEDPTTNCVSDWEKLIEESIIFATNHKDDTSEFVQEETLQLVSGLVRQAVEELDAIYAPTSPPNPF